MSVQRYTVHSGSHGGYANEHPDGPFVTYTDYAPVERERDELRRELDDARQDAAELFLRVENFKRSIATYAPDVPELAVERLPTTALEVEREEQRQELLALRKVADAARAYVVERDNPSPDYSLITRERDRLRDALAELDAKGNKDA